MDLEPDNFSSSKTASSYLQAIWQTLLTILMKIYFKTIETNKTKLNFGDCGSFAITFEGLQDNF